MKNLGHFDEKAVELFKANFSESTEFSEKDEAYDFTRCQRPDGSIYGTSGQCRKGTTTTEKAPEKKVAEKRGRKTVSAPATKSGNTRATKTTTAMSPADRKRAERASAARKAAAEMTPKVKAADKRAKDLNKQAERLDRAFQKQNKITQKSPTKENKDRLKLIQRETRMADRAAKKADREAEKLDRELIRMRKAADAGAAKAKPAGAAATDEKAAKQLKSAKVQLSMEAKGLKEMRDLGITDSRISAAAARVRAAKNKVEELRNKAAKKSGKARPEKSSMATRIAREERNIRSQAGKGNAKAKQYVDLKKRIQEGKVDDPISSRRRLSALRSDLKPASS